MLTEGGWAMYPSSCFISKTTQWILMKFGMGGHRISVTLNFIGFLKNFSSFYTYSHKIKPYK